MNTVELTKREKRELRLGCLAVEVLEIAYNDPRRAYAHAITKAINDHYGMKLVHALEVGHVLRALASDGALAEHEIARHPDTGNRVKLFKPTWKATFYLKLLRSQTSGISLSKAA